MMAIPTALQMSGTVPSANTSCKLYSKAVLLKIFFLEQYAQILRNQTQNWAYTAKFYRQRDSEVRLKFPVYLNKISLLRFYRHNISDITNANSHYQIDKVTLRKKRSTLTTSTTSYLHFHYVRHPIDKSACYQHSNHLLYSSPRISHTLSNANHIRILLALLQ